MEREKKRDTTRTVDIERLMLILKKLNIEVERFKPGNIIYGASYCRFIRLKDENDKEHKKIGKDINNLSKELEKKIKKLKEIFVLEAI